MVNIEFRDDRKIFITDKLGRPLFSGEAKDMTDKELYELIQCVSMLKSFLLDENKTRKHG